MTVGATSAAHPVVVVIAGVLAAFVTSPSAVRSFGHAARTRRAAAPCLSISKVPRAEASTARASEATLRSRLAAGEGTSGIGRGVMRPCWHHYDISHSDASRLHNGSDQKMKGLGQGGTVFKPI